MAKTYTVSDTAKITITNEAEEVVIKGAYTGERVEKDLATAKAEGYTEFEYVLDADGNFVTADDADPAEDGANVVVIVRQAVLSTDRMVQFYRTQQKLKLAKGDSVEIPVKTAAEVAFYMGYDGFNGLTVTADGVVTEA